MSIFFVHLSEYHLVKKNHPSEGTKSYNCVTQVSALWMRRPASRRESWMGDLLTSACSEVVTGSPADLSRWAEDDKQRGKAVDIIWAVRPAFQCAPDITWSNSRHPAPAGILKTSAPRWKECPLIVSCARYRLELAAASAVRKQELLSDK